MAGSLFDKIDQEFGTTEPIQEEEVTTSGNLLDKIDSEFGKLTKPVAVPIPKSSTDKATIGPVLKESGKITGRSILETVRGILSSYDISPKERSDLEKIGVSAWKEKDYKPIPGVQLIQTAKNSKYLKANEAVLKDMSFIDQVVMAALNMGVAAAISIATRKPSLGASYMGIQIMGSSIENSVAQGVDLRTATKYGFINAIAQYPLEELGISKATKLWKFKTAIANRVKGIVEASLTEGTTEGLQVIPERVTDILASNPSMSTLEAVWNTLSDVKTYKQMGLEGSIGAIFGFAIGSGGAIKSYTLNEAANKVTDKDITVDPKETIFDAELEEKPTVVRKKVPKIEVPDDPAKIPSKLPKHKTVEQLEKAKQRIEEVAEAGSGTDTLGVVSENRPESKQTARDLVNKLIEEKSNVDEKIKPEKPQDTIKQDAVAETPRETDSSKTEPKAKEGKVRYKELSNIVGRNPETGAIIPLGSVEGLTGKDKITEEIVAQIKEFHNKGIEQGLEVGIQDTEGNFVERKDIANRLKISEARAAKESKDYMGDVAQAESKERKKEKRIQKLGEAAAKFTPEQKGIIKKHEKLIKKVANKRAGILEADELAQEANLALVEFIAEGKTGQFDPNGSMLKAINEARGEGIATRGEIEGGAEIRITQAGTQEGQLDVPQGGFDQSEIDAQALEEIRKKYYGEEAALGPPGISQLNLTDEQKLARMEFQKKQAQEATKATVEEMVAEFSKKKYENPKRQFLVKRDGKQEWIDEKDRRRDEDTDEPEKILDKRVIGGTEKALTEEDQDKIEPGIQQKNIGTRQSPGRDVTFKYMGVGGKLQKGYQTKGTALAAAERLKLKNVRALEGLGQKKGWFLEYEVAQTKEVTLPKDVSSPPDKNLKGSKSLDTANAMAKVQVEARKRLGKDATQKELRKAEADILAGRTIATKERTKAQKKKKITKNEKIATKQPVATKYKGKMYRGEIHPLIKLDIAEKTGDNLETIEKNAEDGFVTEKGRFVGRKEAAKIAKQADQLDETPVAEIGLDTQDLKGSKTAVQIRKEKKAKESAAVKNPLSNQRGSQSVNLPSLRQPIADFLDTLKKSSIDKISVVASWKRMGLEDVGKSIKNFFAHRIIHEDRANDMLVKMVKNVKQTFPKIKRAKLDSKLTDIVLAAENKAYWNNLSPQEKSELRIPVTMLRSYFDNSLATLQKAGIGSIDFYHNLRTKLEETVRTTTDWDKRTKALKELRDIRDLSYVHIPYSKWFPTDPKKLAKLPKAKRTSFQMLAAKKRHAMSIGSLIEKGFITKADVDPVTIVLDYGNAVGKDMALLNIRDEVVKAGLAVKKKSRPQKPKDPRDKIALLQTKKLGVTPAKAKTIQKQIDKLEKTLADDIKTYETTVDTMWVKFPKSSKKYQAFDGYWVDARVKEGIDTAFMVDIKPTKWDKFVAHTKLSQFYMPLFMPVYDVHQSLAMAGGFGNPTAWIKAQAKGWSAVMNHDPIVEELTAMGTYSQPFNTPSSNFADQVKDIKAVSSKGGAIGVINDQLNIFLDRTPGFLGKRSRVPVYNAVMNLAWNTAWKMDHMVRTGTAIYLMEQGMSMKEASEVAAKVHADYADVPASTRHKLNKFIFTPTFAISMGKVTASMVNNAVKTGMGFTPSSKVDQRLGWGLMTTLGTLAGVSAWFSLAGYEPDEWGKKWIKTVNTSQGKREIVVSVASPINKVIGYAYWLSAFTNPAETSALGNLLRKAQNQSTPVIRTALGMINNRKMDGSKITPTFGDTTIVDYAKFVATELVGLLGTDMMSQYLGGSSERFSNEAPKIKEQLNSDISFLLKVLNKMQMIHIYAKQDKDTVFKSQVNRLNRQLLYEIKDSYLRKEKNDIKGWMKNYKERVDELNKRRKEKGE